MVYVNKRVLGGHDLRAQGVLFGGRAMYFSDLDHTNNKLEVHVILSIVKALYTLYVVGQLLVRLVVIRGDIETMIRSLPHDNKVKKVKLVAMVQEVQELVKKLKGIWVLFCYAV